MKAIIQVVALMNVDGKSEKGQRKLLLLRDNGHCVPRMFLSSTLTGETARIVRFTFAQNATQGSFLPPAFSHLRTKPKWTPLWQEDRKFQEMALWSLASGSLGKCASHARKLRPSQSGNSNKAMVRYEIDGSALLCELCKVGLG